MKRHPLFRKLWTFTKDVILLVPRIILRTTWRLLNTGVNFLNIFRGWEQRYKHNQQLRAVATSPGIAIAILFFLLSTFVLNAIKLGSSIDLSLFGFALHIPSIVVIVITPIICVAIALLIGGRITIYTFTPLKYAELVVSGRPIDEAVFIVAKKMGSLLKRLTETIMPLENRIDDLYLKHIDNQKNEDLLLTARCILNEWGKYVDDVKKLHISLNKYMEIENSSLQRMEKMILVIAKETGVSENSLYNHIFQFDIILFKSSVNQYKEALRELTSLSNSDGKRIISNEFISKRVIELIKRCYYLQNAVSKRIEYLQDIENYRKSLFGIFEIASSHSASQATKLYAGILSELSTQVKNELKTWKGNLDSESYSQVEKHLYFISRKVRAYSGHNVHENLMNIIYLRASNNSSTEDIELLDVLGRFRDNIKQKNDDNKYILITKKDKLSQNNQAENQKNTSRATTSLMQLERVFDIASEQLAESKEAIFTSFEAICKKWFDDIGEHSSRTIYRNIITHGYSNNVVHQIKNTFASNVFSSGHNRVLLITNEGNLEDSKLMRSEINSIIQENKLVNTELVSVRDSTLHVAVGLNSRTLVVLGAECYDADQRIIHPKGFKSYIHELKKYHNQNGINVEPLVIVVAEKYKQQRNLLMKSNFSDNNFKHMDVYDYSDFDLLITEDGIERGDWERVIQEKKGQIWHKYLNMRPRGDSNTRPSV